MSKNDVVYYNLTVGNNDPASAGELNYSSIPANIDAFNNMPIIQNPDDYYCAIIRFTIPAINLPLLTFLVQTNQANINLGVYAFTIIKGFVSNLPTGQASFGSTSGPVYVLFDPTVSVKPFQVPTSPVGNLQQITPYYLLYDYTTFIAMWNTALATAHAVLYPASTTPPFFKFDPPTQLITLYTPAVYETDNAAIGINNQLLQYMLGLPKIAYNPNGPNLANGLDNVIIPRYDQYASGNIVSGATINFYANQFQYNSYGYWNFLKSMLITTTMNVASEAVYNFNNANAITNNSLGVLTNQQNVNYVNILEDFVPDLAIPNGAGVANSIFTYFAQSLYRVFTFNQKTPLYKINLAISIVDVYGNIYPLTIPKGQLANFKLMFIRKEIYASMPKFLN
jgi:hypothetical protein